MVPDSGKKAHPGSAKRKPVKPSKPKPPPKPVVSSRPSPSVSIPKGSFEHIVIILKENHTFDCYFGTFPGAEGDSTLAHASDPPTGRFSNNHAAWLKRATTAVREQYHQADIASYWAYAQQFTLCDNFFTDVASDFSKTLHSFVSIVKFCEENFGVPSINQRDGSADDMSDCFDFTQKPLGPPK
jgi:phospholipase C